MAEETNTISYLPSQALEPYMELFGLAVLSSPFWTGWVIRVKGEKISPDPEKGSSLLLNYAGYSQSHVALLHHHRLGLGCPLGNRSINYICINLHVHVNFFE